MVKGGITEAKPLSYDPPKGPQYQMHERPGLGGGINHGNGSMPSGKETGKPGIEHTNHGCCGSQGRY